MSDLRSCSFWPLLTAVLIGMPVMYVASVGPVYRVTYSLPIDLAEAITESIYWPVWRICDELEYAEELMCSYVAVCSPTPIERNEHAMSFSIPAEEPASGVSGEAED